MDFVANYRERQCAKITRHKEKFFDGDVVSRSKSPSSPEALLNRHVPLRLVALSALVPPPEIEAVKLRSSISHMKWVI